jgi:hypothetical protein
MFIKTFATLAAVAAVAALAGCVGPTPYRAAGAEGNNFGYASSKLSEQLYRVRFTGSTRTPLRWIDAFVLYRSAQVAKEAGAPAFKIVEGTIDTTVLTGEDIYGQGNPLGDVEVSRMAPALQIDSDRVVNAHSPYLQRMAGTMPVFRAPPPAPMVKGQAPLLIYIPSSGAAPVLPARSVLVELRPDLQNMDEKTFATEDVLARLGPRIKRGAPPTDAPLPASTT